MSGDSVALATLLIAGVGLLLKVINSYTGRVEKQIGEAAAVAHRGLIKIEAENKALRKRVEEAEKALLWVARSPRRTETGRHVLSQLLIPRDDDEESDG